MSVAAISEPFCHKIKEFITTLRHTVLKKKVEIVTFAVGFPVFAVLLSAARRRRDGRGRSVLLGFDLGFALQFLHLGPLVLEPNLDHPNAQSRFFGQSFAHFTARLGTYFERGFELTSLGRCQDRPRPFGSPAAIVTRSIVLIGC